MRLLPVAMCIGVLLGVWVRAGAQPPVGQWGHLGVDRTGWSVLTPSQDSRSVYVSHSRGKDSYDGLSPATPKRTLAAGYGLLRDGYPDWLYLQRGDAWTDPMPSWNKSGRSSTEPMVVRSFGAGPRPLLVTRQARGFDLTTYPTARAHLAITEVHCWCNANFGGSPDAGVQILNSWSDVLIEDCRFDQYSTNIAIQGIETRPRDIRIRRCIINGSVSSSGLSSGILIGHTDNVLIEENLLDHNGWNLAFPGCAPTIFSHNCYVNPDNTSGIVTRRNIVARGAASGLRSSGWLCEENLILQNPVGIALGPDTRIVRNNVVLDSRDVDANDVRGLGMDGTISAGVQIYGNIFAHQTSGTGNTKAMNLNGNYTGLRVHDNLVYNWVQTVNAQAPALVLDGNPDGIIRVYHNQFQQASGALIAQSVAGSPLVYSYWGNRYYNTGNPWPFLSNPAPLSFEDWVAQSGETDAQFGALAYPDPMRTILKYMGSIGGALSLEAFLELAGEQSRASWRPQITAAAVNAYVREGFGQRLITPCVLDINGDGAFDLQDLLLFQTYLAHGDPRADLNGDGAVNPADMAVFQGAMTHGCP